MLLFLIYVVYTPGTSVKNFLCYVGSVIAMGCRSLCDCCCPARAARRKAAREAAERARELDAADDEPRTRMRRARDSVIYAGATALRGAGAVARLSIFVAGTATHYACDGNYLVRFWLIYVLLEFLVVLVFVFLLFNVIILSIGSKSACHWMYQYVIPPVKSQYRYLRQGSLNGCFRDLTQVAEGLDPHKTFNEDCTIDFDNGIASTGSIVLIGLGTGLLIVAHSLLTRWWPCAMAFAKPAPLERHLKKIMREGVDRAAAKILKARPPEVVTTQPEPVVADDPPLEFVEPEAEPLVADELKADEAPLEDAPPADVEPVLLVPTAEDHGFPKEVPAEEGIPVVAEARDLTQPEPSPATYFCGPLMCDQTEKTD